MIDVARRAGVAESTVSRAFSAPELISDDVVARVMQAAKDLNYTINTSARSLASNRAGAVLVLIPDIGSAFFGSVLKGIEQKARELSLAVLIGEVESDPDSINAYVGQIESRRADGIILLSGRTASPSDFVGAGGGKSPHYPFVVIGATEQGSSVPTVGVDNERAAYQAVRYLIGLGHRGIAHIAGPRYSAEMNARREGYMRALREAGIEARDGYLKYGNLTAAVGRDIGQEFALMPDGPTAIFCANDETAIGAMAGYRACGLDVPAGVSIVGFDDSQLAGMLNPPLTTVRQPSFELGQKAMAILYERLTRPSAKSGNIVLEAQLIIRQSSASPPSGIS